MYSPCLYVHVYEISDNVYAKLQCYHVTILHQNLASIYTSRKKCL